MTRRKKATKISDKDSSGDRREGSGEGLKAQLLWGSTIKVPKSVVTEKNYFQMKIKSQLTIEFQVLFIQ